MRHLVGILLNLLCASAYAERAPDFSLTDSRGTVVSLDDFKGRPLVLYFMSFRCQHCQAIQPAMQRLHSDSAGRYVLLGVVFGTRQNELNAAAARAGVAFRLAAGNKAVRESFKVPGTPYFALMDAGGRFAERFSGVIGATVLQQVLHACSADAAGLARCLAAHTGLRELVRAPGEFDGKVVRTGGLLTTGGGPYFPEPRFAITNGLDRLTVSPWLPVEVAPRPPQARRGPAKPVMSELLGRYVSLEGRLRLVDGQPLLEVTRATPGW